MANTRNQQEKLSINLCDRNITAYLVEKTEPHENSIYAFTFAGKIHTLTKKAIDKLLNISNHIVFSESRMLETLSRFDLKKTGLITPELEKTLLDKTEESNNNLMAFHFENSVYFATMENLPTLCTVLRAVYVLNKNAEDAKAYLSQNSVYPPLSTEQTSDHELIDKLVKGDITQPTSTTDQQQHAEQNNTENKQETKATKKPTIHGLMFFSEPTDSEPELCMYKLKRQ